jgi:hypothetical protein
MSTPRYRADIKGQVAQFLDDFQASVAGEINNPESMNFLLCVEDADAYEEFKDYLTDKEMTAAFKRAQRVGAP